MFPGIEESQAGPRPPTLYAAWTEDDLCETGANQPAFGAVEFHQSGEAWTGLFPGVVETGLSRNRAAGRDREKSRQSACGRKTTVPVVDTIRRLI